MGRHDMWWDMDSSIAEETLLLCFTLMDGSHVLAEMGGLFETLLT